MLRSLIGFVLAFVLPASLALAQVPSASRLDDVIKSGKLRVCTPGDYKPFSFQRPMTCSSRSAPRSRLLARKRRFAKSTLIL